MALCLRMSVLSCSSMLETQGAPMRCGEETVLVLGLVGARRRQCGTPALETPVWKCPGPGSGAGLPPFVTFLAFPTSAGMIPWP